MELNKYKNIYFIGIGGSGMSALANYFVLENKNVSGYDKTMPIKYMFLYISNSIIKVFLFR